MLQYLRQQARRELLTESRKHAITVKLRQIPFNESEMARSSECTG
jgi:hypothetical protein